MRLSVFMRLDTKMMTKDVIHYVNFVALSFEFEFVKWLRSRYQISNGKVVRIALRDGFALLLTNKYIVVYFGLRTNI